MALNPDFLGRTYPPSEVYEVSREKIREFATAIGDSNPAYHDPEAARALGYPDVIAPTTFLIIVSSRASDVVIYDPELGLDYNRVVHGDQRFTMIRPVHAGDRLVATVTVESIRTVAGNDILGTRADLATEDGEPVGAASALIVSRGEDA